MDLFFEYIEYFAFFISYNIGVVGARPGIEDTKATLSNLRANYEYTVYLTATNTLETSEAFVLKQVIKHIRNTQYSQVMENTFSAVLVISKLYSRATATIYI